MRMTKQRKALLRLYTRERARGFNSSPSLLNARTRMEWDKREVAEYSDDNPIDPKRGQVRLRIVADECAAQASSGVPPRKTG